MRLRDEFVKLVLTAMAASFLALAPSICHAGSAGLNQSIYSEGNIFAITTVSDTTTASGYTQITGSPQNQKDLNGNRFQSSAYQMYALDANGNAVDFYYSFSANPLTYMRWFGTWGPMQRYQVLPNSGIYVAPTFTYAGSIYVYFESMQ